MKLQTLRDLIITSLTIAFMFAAIWLLDYLF